MLLYKLRTKSYYIDFLGIYSIEPNYPSHFIETYDALSNGIISDNIKTKTVDWYKYLLNNPDVAKNFMINDALI